MTPQGSPRRGLLPPELVISIFHLLYIDKTTPRISKGDSSHKLLNLMLVCKSFKQLIQSTPAFWTELWVVRTEENTEEQEASWLEWIEKQITKSEELPLRVFFILSPMPFKKIYPILLPTSPRWAHLTITPLSEYGEDDLTPFQPLIDAPIPQLRSLFVEGFMFWSEGRLDNTGTVFRHAPKLVKLEWHDRFVVFRPDSEQAGAVEEWVRLGSVDGAFYYFAQNTLEVLSIKGATLPNDVAFESMVMHRLRFLSLSGFSHHWFFLEAWQLPVLEELHITGDPYDEVTEPTNPTFPALTTIEWLDTEPNSAPADPQSNYVFLSRVLAAAPELQSFSIRTADPSTLPNRQGEETHMQPTDRIWPFLSTNDAPRSPKYCPQLRDLRLPKAGFDELERLAKTRPQLEKLELVALRRDATSPSLEGDLARLERVKESVEVIFHEWV